MPKERVDTIFLGGHHSMVYVPGIKPKNNKNDSMAFGLWNNTSPNLVTYYPEVEDAKSIEPKDSEFIYPVYRLLSVGIIKRQWDAIEFTEPVLKKSMDLMVGQSIYTDHESVTGNELGSVLQTVWDPSYSIDKKQIPAGINGVLKIDAKSNPRIARGILMDPPSIHSDSVSVTFTWVKSHPDMTDEDFYNQLGTYDSKGVLVRRVADSIVLYSELSLVPHGADPFAKKVDSTGKIVLFKNALQRASKLSANEEPNFNILTDKDLLDIKSKITLEDYSSYFSEATPKLANYNFKDPGSLTIPSILNNHNNNSQNKIKNMDELLVLLATTLSLEITAENFKSPEILNKLTALKAAMDSKDGLTTENATLKQENATLKQENTTLKAQAEDKITPEQKVKISLAESVIGDLRKVALSNYKLTLGEGVKPSPEMVSFIEQGEYTALKVINGSFLEKIEKMMPLTCQDCHGHNVSRSSAALTDDEQKGGNKGKNTIKTNEQLMESYDSKIPTGRGIFSTPIKEKE